MTVGVTGAVVMGAVVMGAEVMGGVVMGVGVVIEVGEAVVDKDGSMYNVYQKKK